jgi:hypothetical protein
MRPRKLQPFQAANYRTDYRTFSRAQGRKCIGAFALYFHSCYNIAIILHRKSCIGSREVPLKALLGAWVLLAATKD